MDENDYQKAKDEWCGSKGAKKIHVRSDKIRRVVTGAETRMIRYDQSGVSFSVDVLALRGPSNSTEGSAGPALPASLSTIE